ncbi:Ubiquitin-conjugating enzyme E2 E2 [Hondaea fermentalgiana]|uniref:Ubiquitin-conjugating enzyme E2 E2 n=1 Tax=Hondaea fermentalgiana TaxID=2315210 RepID=A0A2R5GB09_9STRA|nr:Ubiquitin-conjugating enzyme E2 E2 [Hondaea fermentalgiana]|eukprot:GBG25743.1 Ubiquitin-conjugating enzyme E2 E2 [Hondaea fermentalgiana]
MAHKPSKRRPDTLVSREFYNLRRKPRSNYFQVHDCVNNDVTAWDVFIIGPPGTAYQNGIYRAVMRFPDSYPMEPPSIQFSCKMYHPNIYRDGKVCISTLQCPPRGELGANFSEYWRPVLGAEQALLSVVSLLSDPNVNDPANQYAAQLWVVNRPLFDLKCEELARESRKSVPRDFIAPVVAHLNSEAAPASSSSSSSSSSSKSSQAAGANQQENNNGPATAAAAEDSEAEVEYVYSDDEDAAAWTMREGDDVEEDGDDDETDHGAGTRSVDERFSKVANGSDGNGHGHGSANANGAPSQRSSSSEESKTGENIDVEETTTSTVNMEKTPSSESMVAMKRKRSSDASLSSEEVRGSAPVLTSPNSASSAMASPRPDQIVHIEQTGKRRKQDAA